MSKANYKRYWNLEERERAALNEDEVQAYLAVELMERGVIAPRAPVPEPILEPSLERESVFVIAYGYSDTLDLAFPTFEAAQAFLGLGAQLIKRDWQAGNARYLEPIDQARVQSASVTTQDAALAARAELRENTARKERNETARRAYEQAIESVDKETRDIWADWKRCRGLVADHLRVMETWATYVAMTGGDEAVAWKFLTQAFGMVPALAAFEFSGEPLPAGVATADGAASGDASAAIDESHAAARADAGGVA